LTDDDLERVASGIETAVSFADTMDCTWVRATLEAQGRCEGARSALGTGRLG